MIAATLCRFGHPMRWLGRRCHGLVITETRFNESIIHSGADLRKAVEEGPRYPGEPGWHDILKCPRCNMEFRRRIRIDLA